MFVGSAIDATNTAGRSSCPDGTGRTQKVTMPVKRTTGTGQLVYSLCWGGEDVVKEDVLRSPRMLPLSSSLCK